MRSHWNEEKSNNFKGDRTLLLPSHYKDCDNLMFCSDSSKSTEDISSRLIDLEFLHCIIVSDLQPKTMTIPRKLVHKANVKGQQDGTNFRGAVISQWTP